MIDREQVIRGLELCVSHDSDKCCKCPYRPQCQEYYYTALNEDALTLLKEQQKTINALESDLKETLQVLEEKGGIVNELYDLLNETCKDFREATGDDNVCGLCHYEGCAYKGEEDWCGWCPGFDSDECFVMKNEIRKMAGKELLPDVDPQ